MSRLRRVTRRNQAWNADFLLERTHAEHDHEIREQVDDRRRRKGFEYAEAELLHGARAPGELEQPDRQRDRRVLDDVYELGGERRQDDAKALRQDHVAVGLRLAESERRARQALAARQRIDAGAYLFRDAHRSED